MSMPHTSRAPSIFCWYILKCLPHNNIGRYQQSMLGANGVLFGKYTGMYQQSVLGLTAVVCDMDIGMSQQSMLGATDDCVWQ